MRLAGNPSIADALRWATSAGIDRLDGQLLLLHAVGRPNHDRSWLVAHDDQRLQAPEVGTFEALVARRLAGEPLAYIVGVKEFFGLSFGVSNAVLIPRPDTETVVQWALQTIKALETDASAPHILDLGTGSGAIALAIKSQAPQCLVTAIDASATALAQAARNGQQLGLDVTWRQSDWFASVDHVLFDVIVSNPPYIAANDPHLRDLRHEPLSALASGADGLDDLRHIIAHSGPYLREGGWLLLEHGYDQAKPVAELLKAAGFKAIGHQTDLGGVTRCTGGRW
ncbi:MAG: peptide chain release factor N(5)-glutamine methyltransferase [Burkholderiaceae bacterium]